MIIDAAVILLLAGAAWMGWKRGTMRMALSLAGFVGGYAAALFLHRPVGGVLASVTEMPAVLAYPIAGLVVMLVVSLFFRYWGSRVRIARQFKTHRGEKHWLVDHAGGALLAGAVGAGLVVVGAFLATSLTELQGQPFPQLRDSHTGRLSAVAAERTIYWALSMGSADDQLASSMAGVLANPSRAAQSIQNLTRSPLFHRLAADGSFMEAFRRGDAEQIARHPAMEEMLRDQSFQEVFETFNVTDGSGGTEDLAATLSLFGGGMATLRGDDSFQGSPLGGQILEGISSGTLDLVEITRSPDLADMLTRINESMRARESAVRSNN